MIVYGPEKVLASVERAYVEVTRTDVDRTLSFESTYVLLDAEGNEFESDELSFSDETVTVTLPVRAVKEVSLTVELVAGGGATDANVKWKLEPSTVILTGDADTLSGVNSIAVARIDLAEVEEAMTATYRIEIPNNTEVTSGTRETTLTLELTGAVDGLVDEAMTDPLLEGLHSLGKDPTPVLLLREGTPKDYSFRPIAQYGDLMTTETCSDFSALLDRYYGQRDREQRIHSRGQSLRKTVTNLHARLTRKLEAQSRELAAAQDREQLRRRGDILTARWLRNQIWWLIMGVAMAFVYVSNRYYAQKQMIHNNHLKEELKETHYDAMARSSQLMRNCRRSIIVDKLSDSNNTLVMPEKQPATVME